MPWGPHLITPSNIMMPTHEGRMFHHPGHLTWWNESDTQTSWQKEKQWDPQIYTSNCSQTSAKNQTTEVITVITLEFSDPHDLHRRFAAAHFAASPPVPGHVWLWDPRSVDAQAEPNWKVWGLRLSHGDFSVISAWKNGAFHHGKKVI